jgi:hypothetical protein
MGARRMVMRGRRRRRSRGCRLKQRGGFSRTKKGSQCQPWCFL